MGTGHTVLIGESGHRSHSAHKVGTGHTVVIGESGHRSHSAHRGKWAQVTQCS